MAYLTAAVGLLIAAAIVWGGRSLAGLLGDVSLLLATAVRLWESPQTVDERPPEWLLEIRAELDELLLRTGKQLREIKSQHASATHAIRRVRTELADAGRDSDERVEWLADEFGLEDGDGSEEGGVLPMRGELETVPIEAPQASDAQGWLELANARKFG